MNPPSHWSLYHTCLASPVAPGQPKCLADFVCCNVVFFTFRPFACLHICLLIASWALAGSALCIALCSRFWAPKSRTQKQRPDMWRNSYIAHAMQKPSRTLVPIRVATTVRVAPFPPQFLPPPPPPRDLL